MENERTKYYLRKCQTEDCPNTLVIRVPISKISESGEPINPFTVEASCPKCHTAMVFASNKLNKPLSEAEYKMALLLIEKHKNKIVEMLWVSDD